MRRVSPQILDKKHKTCYLLPSVIGFMELDHYLSKSEDVAMSREVRRVPGNWEHPKDERGHYIPHHERFPHDEDDIEEGPRDGSLKNEPSNYGCNVMPQWPDSERTHYQMYECTTEGTPISPVMESPEALARWLADNQASACGVNQTATYEQWLCMIQAGSSLGTFVMEAGSNEFPSGVEVISRHR